MERFGGPPEWTSHSHEERTAQLLLRVGGKPREGGRRRLQWAWQDADAKARDDGLANVSADCRRRRRLRHLH